MVHVATDLKRAGGVAAVVIWEAVAAHGLSSGGGACEAEDIAFVLMCAWVVCARVEEGGGGETCDPERW